MDKDTSIAADAYALMAERYDAMAPTKAHNGLYERPAIHALLGDVEGHMVLDEMKDRDAKLFAELCLEPCFICMKARSA